MNKTDWVKFVLETLNMMLPKEFDNVEFANGSGYIQLSIMTHARFMLRYREVIECTMPTQLDMFDQNPAGFIGRYLDDSGSPAYALYIRAACIDGKFRMWGQPHFAKNPDDAKMICLANV